MSKIKFDANIYDKEVLLYVLNMYDINYEIKFNDNSFEVIIEEKIENDGIKEIKKKVNENQLRKDISNSNKKIREYIIATALWFPEEF